MEKVTELKRTNKQNSSLHKFCRLLADELNEAGYDMKDVLFGSEEQIFLSISETLRQHGIVYKSDLIEDIIAAIFSGVQIDIPWTMESVKNHLWRPIQLKMTGKESTTEMNTIDPTPIHQVLMRHLGQVFGIKYIEWPSLR